MIPLILSLVSAAFASGFCEVNDPGSAAFIRNEYVELGICSEGAFGEEGYTSGWHYRSNTEQLGFVANPQADGWSTYYGDFFSPGSPLESWGLEVDGVSYDNTNDYGTEIVGSISDPACEVDICGNLGGFFNDDASDIWSGSGFYSSVGSSQYDDAAISLAVRIGDMAPR